MSTLARSQLNGDLTLRLYLLATWAGSPQQRQPITVGPYYLSHPEPTGEPGENLRLSAERYTLFTRELCSSPPY